jgi:cytochrome c-type biogenesis protein CcmH
MILFWLICSVLLLMAVIFVLYPLLHKTSKNNTVLRDAANLEILRNQASELEADLHNNLLTNEAFEQGKRELHVRLIEEVNPDDHVVAPRYSAHKLAVVLLILIPLTSVLLYQKIGTPQALLPQPTQDTGGVLSSEASLMALEAKLAKEPEDAKGWMILAQSYTQLERYADAVRAFQYLVKLVPDESEIWTNYADALAMKNNQSLLGQPTEFINRALQLDPNNTTALALIGSSDMERGDYAAAIKHWQKLVNLLPPDYPQIQMIHDGIKQAQAFLAKGNKSNSVSEPATPVVAISGKVVLSAQLMSKTSPEDVVYILARAASGPKMPLAVLRRQVKDLPMDFTLDDSMAMQPQLKLSSFDQVVVVARVSKSGSPMSQAGDLEGTAGIVKPGATGLNIKIDQLVK